MGRGSPERGFRVPRQAGVWQVGGPSAGAAGERGARGAALWGGVEPGPAGPRWGPGVSWHRRVRPLGYQTAREDGRGQAGRLGRWCGGWRWRTQGGSSPGGQGGLPAVGSSGRRGARMGSLLFVSCTSAVSPGQAPLDLLLGVPEPDVMGPVISRPAPGGTRLPLPLPLP